MRNGEMRNVCVCVCVGTTKGNLGDEIDAKGWGSVRSLSKRCWRFDNLLHSLEAYV